MNFKKFLLSTHFRWTNNNTLQLNSIAIIKKCNEHKFFFLTIFCSVLCNLIGWRDDRYSRWNFLSSFFSLWCAIWPKGNEMEWNICAQIIFKKDNFFFVTMMLNAKYISTERICGRQIEIDRLVERERTLYNFGWSMKIETECIY